MPRAIIGSVGRVAWRCRDRPSADPCRDARLVAVPYLIIFLFVCLLGILATCVLL
jgi:hypothetical protein